MAVLSHVIVLQALLHGDLCEIDRLLHAQEWWGTCLTTLEHPLLVGALADFQENSHIQCKQPRKYVNYKLTLHIIIDYNNSTVCK